MSYIKSYDFFQVTIYDKRKYAFFLEDRTSINLISRIKKEATERIVKSQDEIEVISAYKVDYSYEIKESDLCRFILGVRKIHIDLQNKSKESLYSKDLIGNIVTNEFNLIKSYLE